MASKLVGGDRSRACDLFGGLGKRKIHEFASENGCAPMAKVPLISILFPEKKRCAEMGLCYQRPLKIFVFRTEMPGYFAV